MELVLPATLLNALLAVLVVVHSGWARVQTRGRALNVELVPCGSATVVTDVLSRDTEVRLRTGTVREAFLAILCVVPGVVAATRETYYCSVRVVPVIVRRFIAVCIAQIPV